MNLIKKYWLVPADVLFMILAYWIGLQLRFSIPEYRMHYQLILMNYMGVVLLVKATVNIAFGLYRVMWKFASISEYVNVGLSVLVGNALTITYLLFSNSTLPRSIFPIVLILDMIFLAGLRIAFRMAFGAAPKAHDPFGKRLLIIGAGQAGDLLLREIRKNPTLHYNVVAFIDDDPEKLGKLIHGVRVIGNREKIQEVVSKYGINEIIIAIPSATDADRKEYIERTALTGAKVRIMPGMYEFINDAVRFSDIKEVSIDDLLQRDSVSLDNESLSGFLGAKTVLITGGGGSIGSELARQVAQRKPKQLVLVDIYENNVYDLQLELKKNYPELDLKVIIESVRNFDHMKQIFSSVHPQIVIHAAAHKHVPLMEDSPQSAVTNNVFGTYNMARLSHLFDLEKFVMVSTDKAVNPTNVMGTTKRIGEMIVQAFDPISKTDFVAVRFGNVLGSSGSVIPLFKRQIREGGPLTVTHEDINRYFMTIPEAAQLVLQAASIAEGGEVFILDMGKPVRIYDLAKDLIRLSGLKLDEDIKIEITGLRPGEKLYEELLLDKTKATQTKHEKIWIEHPESMPLAELEEKLKDLREVTESGNTDRLIRSLMDLVETYTPNREGYERPDASKN